MGRWRRKLDSLFFGDVHDLFESGDTLFDFG